MSSSIYNQIYYDFLLNNCFIHRRDEITHKRDNEADK